MTGTVVSVPVVALGEKNMDVADIEFVSVFGKVMEGPPGRQVASPENCALYVGLLAKKSNKV